MRCLYCGKELALFKRLRGGEFCSDAHRQKYQQEYTQLALSRLLQANAPKDDENGESDRKGLLGEPQAQPESPALKRQERLGREMVPAEASLTEVPIDRLAAQAPKAPSAIAAPAAISPAALLEPEPVPAASAIKIAEPEPDTAPLANFVVDAPQLPELEAPAPLDSIMPLAMVGAPSKPRLDAFPPNPDAAYLDSAGRLSLSLFTVTDFQTPPRERGLELREFVRGVPQVEIHVKPAVDSGFEPVTKPFEVTLDAFRPEDAPEPWLAPELDLAVADAAIGLGDLARLDFALSDWGGEEAEQIRAEAPADEAPSETRPEPAAVVEPVPEAPEMSTRLEPMHLEPTPHESATPAVASRPDPVHFEPVQIDPVFIETLAGLTSIETPALAQDPVAERFAESPADLVEATDPAETAAVQETEALPAEEPAPASITRPLPLTLHGLAPTRGKPVQVFASAILRVGDPQIPRETSLPLRPIMILGPGPKPAVEPAVKPETAKAEPSKPEPSKVEASKPEPVKPEPKPRKAEVRVLPVQVREIKPETSKPETPKAEPREAAKAKEIPVSQKPGMAGKPEPVKAESKAPESSRPVEPAKSAEPAKPVQAPKELDSLGLPSLAFEQKESFWGKLPGVAKAAVIGGVLALIGGGIFLTSRGSSSVKPAPVVSNEPVMIEEPALGNTAGWAQDWFADRAGATQGRHVDVLRGSLGLRDYRLNFEGQIEHGALAWVFRADNKSFYVEKVQVVTPGHDPVVALDRFAVINGVEQPRTRVALPIQAHLDTMYKVRMDAIGDRFTTWVQDQKVDQWTDSQIPVGGAGLYYESGDSYKLRDTLNVVPLRKK